MTGLGIEDTGCVSGPTVPLLPGRGLMCSSLGLPANANAVRRAASSREKGDWVEGVGKADRRLVLIARYRESQSWDLSMASDDAFLHAYRRSASVSLSVTYIYMLLASRALHGPHDGEALKKEEHRTEASMFALPLDDASELSTQLNGGVFDWSIQRSEISHTMRVRRTCACIWIAHVFSVQLFPVTFLFFPGKQTNNEVSLLVAYPYATSERCPCNPKQKLTKKKHTNPYSIIYTCKVRSVYQKCMLQR